MANVFNNEEIDCGAKWLLRKVRTIYLPPHMAEQNSLFHTIFEDEAGNIYISDEINHCVMSLSSTGKILWEHKGKGQGIGQYCYPRGLALGMVRQHAQLIRSLAVCDSWNNRIEIMDLMGGHLRYWSESGSGKFYEISDVQYLIDPAQPDNGIWIALDRSNHRLCALSIDGTQLFEIGKALPPALASKWITQGSDMIYDPLYYPSRIFGTNEDALYIYEPHSGCIKQPIQGNILSLPLDFAHGFECIAADGNMALAWNSSLRELLWLDFQGNPIAQSFITGTPISSFGTATAIWIHESRCLHRLGLFPKMASSSDAGEFYPFKALRISVAADLNSMSPVSEPDAPHTIALLINKYSGICDELLSHYRPENPDASAMHSLRATSRELLAHIHSGLKNYNNLHATIFLKLRLLSATQSFSGSITFDQRNLYERMALRLEPLIQALSKILQLLDETYSLLAQWKHLHPDDFEISGLAVQEQSTELLALAAELTRIAASSCEALPSISRQPVVASKEPSIDNSNTGRLLRPLSYRPKRPGSGWLREIGQLSVASLPAECSSGLSCVIRDLDGFYYVGFFNSGSIARLDREARFVELLFGPGASRGSLKSPLDLAIDSSGRLWISEYNGHRLSIYNPLTSTHSTIEGLDSETTLQFPVGICRGPEDSILIADSGNDRIVSACLPDSIKAFAGHTGTGPLQFRHPLSICENNSPTHNGFWIADERNHRIQQLDITGQFRAQIGRCGPLLGGLIMPQRIAQFSDGVLLIAQNHVDQCLKLFYENGEELNRLLLNYSPSGIRIHNDILYVTDPDRRSIRMYSRE